MRITFGTENKCIFFSFVEQTLMGIFYHLHSVALIEDLPLEHNYKKPSDFYTDADKGYGQVIIQTFP